MSGNPKRFDQPHRGDDENASVLWKAAQESPTRQVDVQRGSNGSGQTFTTVNGGQSAAEIEAQVRDARGQ
ncbi:hypothetical protein NE236_25300 [Actinoallomurus purpureus]|uniref:hypothetical protein n=1 Tax=Actinoallomurus purpureus TaxID=478114 RepID=UPI00209216A3|nr:hypothetical protein [Actinoallomurus purpureus]MCO6008299.1 hypothetical protein [Actinoallomurus purpureus]